MAKKKVKLDKYIEDKESNQLIQKDVFCHCCFGLIDTNYELFKYLKDSMNCKNEGIQIKSGLNYQQCKNCKIYVHLYCGGSTFTDQTCFQCINKNYLAQRQQCIECNLSIRKNSSYAVKIENNNEWIHIICALTSKKFKIMNFQSFQILQRNQEEQIKTKERCDHCEGFGKLYACPQKCQNDINKAHLICFQIKQTQDIKDSLTFNFKIQFRQKDNLELDHQNLQIYCPNCPQFIYCICDSYKSEDQSLQCEICENWYHNRCINIDNLNEISHFICEGCQDYLHNLQNNIFKFPVHIKSFAIREFLRICNLIQKKIQKDQVITQELQIIIDQIPFDLSHIQLTQNQKVQNKQTEKKQQKKKNQNSQSKSISSKSQMNQITQRLNKYDQNEFKQLKKQMIMKNTSYFIEYSILFTNKAKNENFYTFLRFIFEISEQKLQNNTQTTQVYETIINSPLIVQFIVQNLNNYEFQQKISNLNLKFVFQIQNTQVQNALKFVIKLFFTRFIQQLTIKILKKNKNSQCLNLEVIELIYAILFKLQNVTQDLCQSEQNELNILKQKYYNFDHRFFQILENIEKYKQIKDLKCKLDFIENLHSNIKSTIQQYFNDSIDQDFRLQQLKNFKQQFEWVYQLQKILEDIQVSEILNYKQLLIELHEIAKINQWDQLPLVSQLSYLIQEDFQIDKIVQQNLQANNQLFKNIFNIQIENLNLEDIQKVDIFKKIYFYDDQFNFYFMRYFYNSLKITDQDFLQIFNDLKNTQNFVQIISELSNLDVNSQKYIQKIEQAGKILYNQQINYCLEIQGILFLIVFFIMVYNIQLKNQILDENLTIEFIEIGNILKNQNSFQQIQEKYDQIAKNFNTQINLFDQLKDIQLFIKYSKIKFRILYEFKNNEKFEEIKIFQFINDILMCLKFSSNDQNIQQLEQYYFKLINKIEKIQEIFIQNSIYQKYLEKSQEQNLLFRFINNIKILKNIIQELNQKKIYITSQDKEIQNICEDLILNYKQDTHSEQYYCSIQKQFTKLAQIFS